MRRALLTALVTSAAWPAAAAADTVAHRTPVVGPKIAGGQSVWGEEKDEGLRVMIGAPRAEPRALYRLPDSDARQTHRSFFETPWSLSASPTHVAAIVFTGTITQQGSDSVTTSVAPAAVGGPLGAVTLVSGSIPRRGDALCGDDIDADGTIALTYSDDPRARRLALMRVGTPGLHVLHRNVADRGVALAGGRVLHEKLDRGDFRSRMLLREIDGGVRRLATFTPRRRRVGDLDLSPDRAVWAAQKTRSADYEAKPSGPARIVSRPL